MSDELLALDQNRTWIITTLPPSKVPIGCKWIHKEKLKSNGSVDRYKAWLVAKSYSQRASFYYNETFSPVAKHTIIRVFLALAAKNGWHLS